MKPLIAIAARIPSDPSPPSEAYAQAVRLFGGTPRFLDAEDAKHPAGILHRFDALVLAGGGDIDAAFWREANHPAACLSPALRDRAELAWARDFAESGRPVLGICRGMQVLNVALGGTLIGHIPDRPGSRPHDAPALRHSIRIVPDTLLARILGADEARVNSTHHQAAGRLGRGLVCNAAAPDGIVEAVSLGAHALGVQWHPERMMEEHMAPIWAWFLHLCAE